MKSEQRDWLCLEGKRSSFWLDVSGKVPSVLYWGPKLQHTPPSMLAAASSRQEAPASPVDEAMLSLMPTLGSGFTGSSGIRCHRDGRAWDFHPDQTSVTSESKSEAQFTLTDSHNKIAVCIYLKFESQSDVIAMNTKVINLGRTPLTVDWCASGTLPIPSHVNQLTSFQGRWAMEFQTRTHDIITGQFVRENRRGRTSHDSFPGLLAHCSSANEQNGDAFGFHLGWSGNHRLLAERLSDGRAQLQMGELLYPGEVILGPNQHYESPSLYASFSDSGFTGLSQQFHTFVRATFIRDAVSEKPRPIHFNTWEAVYFDHSPEKLMNLADQAASVGAERFVLDDGWFKGRRSTMSGLGDWTVDQEVYPDGLTPLIDHVKGHGMEFGLWVEPEMVNPDSDLYRSHPDWVLKAETTDQLNFRNQLVLDLSKTEVIEHLFQAIDSLLSENQISYLKWDVNRDVSHPGSNGLPSSHKQTRALYALIKKIKEKHPDVEIESCSAGGARADYGILKDTDRIWTSDSNDALDRLAIQKGFSLFFPPEVMGSHIGPKECHITGRNLPIDTRAAVALFGHMGMEVDLADFDQEDLDTLKKANTLHKERRDLLHGGNSVRLDTNAHAIGFGVVSQEKERGLFGYGLVTSHPDFVPESIRFIGLDPALQYKLDLLMPFSFKSYSANLWDTVSDQLFTGECLMARGVQLPIMNPGTILVISVDAV